MTREELAWGFAEVFSELEIDEVNEMLAKNVPLETLDFFNAYGASLAESQCLDPTAEERLPNLMIVGYLLRVLEERLLSDEEH